MSFGFGVGDFVAVTDKLRHCHDRFSEAPELFVSLVKNVEIIEPLLEETQCPQQNLNDKEQQILESIIEGSYTDLKRLKHILDDCKELNKPLDERKWDKSKLLQYLQRLQLDPKVINGIQSSLSVKIILLNTLKNASDSRAIQSTKRMVVLMHDEQVSKHQQKVLEWLTPSNYSSQQRDYFSIRHPETATWLLKSKEFEWVSNKGQTLLCRGMPGAGKTIMTSVVTDHLIHRFREEPRVGIAYVYCNFKETERQTCHDLLSSLAKQLAQSYSPFPQSLEMLYNTHQKGNTSISTQETTDLLQSLCSCYERVFIVIDALDECDRNARQAFLQEILRLQQRHQVNIFATTRDIPEILQSKELNDFIPVEIRASEEDVLRYVSGRITFMQSFVRSNLDLQKEIKDTIASKVDGMFLLARLLIDAWSNKLNPKELKKALKAFGATNGKGNVYSVVYDEAMRRIESQPSERIELALNILSWITGAKRPLKVVELQHALAIEEDEAEIDEDNITPAETMISVCAGLITVSEKSGVVRLVHQTTQEYFEEKRHQFFPELESQIAKICVGYLSFENVYCDDNKSFGPSGWYLDWIEPEPASFFDYAAIHWGDHARACSTIPPEVVKYLRNRAMRDRSLSVLCKLREAPRVPLTPAHVAAYLGIIQLFETDSLQEDEGDLADNSDNTSLWWAAFGNQTDVVKLLLDGDVVQSTALPGPLHGSISSRTVRLSIRAALEETHSATLEALVSFYAKRRFDSELEPDDHALIFRNPWSTHNVFRRPEPIRTREAVFVPKSPPRQPFLTEPGWRAVLHIIASGLDERSRLGWIPRLFELLADCLKHTGQLPHVLREYPGLTEISSYDTGFAEALGLLLSMEAPVNARDPMGRTPLAQAVFLGLNLTVWNLLALGASVDIRDEYGETPVSLAVKTNNWVALSSLVKHGATIEVHDSYLNKRNSDGRSPVSMLAHIGDASLLRLFVEKGADVRAQDSNGRTPMYWAIVNGNIPTLEVFLEMDIDIEYRTSNERRNPLSWAASHSNLQAVQLFIARGSEIDASDENGRTPLDCACVALCSSDRRSIIETLLAHGANTGAGHRNLVWVHAQVSFDLEVVHLFQQYGFDMGSKDAKGRTLLHYAAKSGQLQDLKMLLESTDLDLNLKDDDGRTALWYAMNRGSSWTRRQVTQFILDYPGADRNCSNGQQALQDAIEVRDGRFAKLLIARKVVDVNGVFDGEVPMMTAARKGDLWTFVVLKEHGAVWGHNECSNVEILSETSWRFFRNTETWSYHQGQLL
ncbi:hypothetical protein CaCOL14_003739 [Colletotrichum acutatum]